MVYLTSNENQGFTLIEALVAMVVLTIGILALMTLQGNLVQGNSRASHISEASSWAASEIEEIIDTPFTYLEDLDGDGSNQDQDKNGVDEVGPDTVFGLDDLDNQADYLFTSNDGDFTLHINVAVDIPIEGSKTIRVFIQDNKSVMGNPLNFTYIKQNSI